MENDAFADNINENEKKSLEAALNPEKDFYRGVGGELRLKAEGLFKKAKEKGISIEEINVTTLKEKQVEFPGIGVIELPAYFVTVKGRDVENRQVIMDGKQMDYYNRYQKYVAERIEDKNIVRDDKGKTLKENYRPRIKPEPELFLIEWERFEIGKTLLEDKEFGMEKTITGACDRVIRKLMGENDWLYPEEAKLLDEELEDVQNIILKEKEVRKRAVPGIQRRATERQVNYFKARVRNLGLDADNEAVIKEIMKKTGFDGIGFDELTTGNMSKIIDSINDIVPKVSEALRNKDIAEVNEKIH